MIGRKCWQPRAEGYIEKPINPETFVTEVQRFLQTHGEENKL